MNNLTYTFDDKTHVEIELLENGFVSEWLPYFVETIQKQKEVEYYTSDHAGGNRPVSVLELILDFTTLENSLEFLGNKFNINFTDVIKRIKREKNIIETNSNLFSPTNSQTLLNDIHRIFTRLMNNQNVIGTLPIHEDREVFENVHNINDCVHRLEASFAHRKVTRRVAYKNQPVTHIGANKIDFIEKKYIKHRFDPYSESCDYTVWLNEDILGKDMIRGWLDGDEIHNDDITGNLFHTPNIMLDPFKTIKSIVERPAWQDFYKNTHKTLDRFPIGNIVNKEDWALRRAGLVIEIRLNNDILFKKDN